MVAVAVAVAAEMTVASVIETVAAIAAESVIGIALAATKGIKNVIILDWFEPFRILRVSSNGL